MPGARDLAPFWEETYLLPSFPLCRFLLLCPDPASLSAPSCWSLTGEGGKCSTGTDASVPCVRGGVSFLILPPGLWYDPNKDWGRGCHAQVGV